MASRIVITNGRSSVVRGNYSLDAALMLLDAWATGDALTIPVYPVGQRKIRARYINVIHQRNGNVKIAAEQDIWEDVQRYCQVRK